MFSLKQVAKKIAPQGVKTAYGRANSVREGAVGFSYDKRRFLKSHGRRTSGRNAQAHIDGRLVFHAHAIEKGLSHQVVRLGFGKVALKALARNIQQYQIEGYPKDGAAYRNALSVLRAYVELHERENFNIHYLNDLFSTNIMEEAMSDISGLGGIYNLNIESKKTNESLNFKDLFINRWSIREYSDKPVNHKKIEEVIEIARKTPSICNRQSSRATVIYDKEIIDKALKLQGGIKGYQLPPALIMVTTDTSAFVDVNERNQVWIDGGLYAMSVLTGLEYVSLGACPLNAMMSVKNDKKMRQLLNIPASENIIMFISVGNFLDENKVPKSFRYEKDSVSRVI